VIRVYFHAEAERELDDAAVFYESRVPGLGRSFSAEVERTLRLLRDYPDAGAPAGAKRRRVLVDRFPNFVAYERRDDSIIILAVGHRSGAPAIGASEVSALTTVSRATRLRRASEPNRWAPIEAA